MNEDADPDEVAAAVFSALGGIPGVDLVEGELRRLAAEPDAETRP